MWKKWIRRKGDHLKKKERWRRFHKCTSRGIVPSDLALDNNDQTTSKCVNDAYNKPVAKTSSQAVDDAYNKPVTRITPSDPTCGGHEVYIKPVTRGQLRSNVTTAIFVYSSVIINGVTTMIN